MGNKLIRLSNVMYVSVCQWALLRSTAQGCKHTHARTRAFDPLVPCVTINQRCIHARLMQYARGIMCAHICYIPRQRDGCLRFSFNFLLVVIFTLILLRFESDTLNSTFVGFSLKLPFEIHIFLLVPHDQCNCTTNKKSALMISLDDRVHAQCFVCHGVRWWTPLSLFLCNSLVGTIQK